MSKRKRPPATPQRPAEEQRRRFGWVDDDVLFLQIDGQEIQSPGAPPPKRKR